MSKKRNVQRRERNGVRKFWYIFIMVLLAIIYLCGQNFCDWEWLTEVFATTIAIITAVAFWLEYNENKLLNEAQFITDLNEQFICNDKMSEIEWELEKFYNKYRKGEVTEEYLKAFREKYDLENRDRQHLVNYLVHLEGIAALVKNKVLHIDMIDDLMSYRYFIAMNNPVVQEIELLEYPDFYKGCIQIYQKWVNHMETKEKVKPPMYDKDSNNLIKKLEDKKQCLQKRN